MACLAILRCLECFCWLAFGGFGEHEGLLLLCSSESQVSRVCEFDKQTNGCCSVELQSATGCLASDFCCLVSSELQLVWHAVVLLVRSAIWAHLHWPLDGSLARSIHCAGRVCVCVCCSKFELAGWNCCCASDIKYSSSGISIGISISSSGQVEAGEAAE